MATVKIRHAGFVYHKKHTVTDVHGKQSTTWNPVVAYRGDTVNIELESDLEDGHRHGAFWTDDYYPEGHDYSGAPKGTVTGTQFTDKQIELSEDIPDVMAESDEALALWVADHTVAQVLKAATTPDAAARLAEAEENATGRDPRKSLLEGLEKIVDQAE